MADTRTDPTPERPESPSQEDYNFPESATGIARYAWDTFSPHHQFSPEAIGWRFCHTENLIQTALDAAREQGRREEESKWSAMLDAGRLVTSGECDSREGAARDERPESPRPGDAFENARPSGRCNACGLGWSDWKTFVNHHCGQETRAAYQRGLEQGRREGLEALRKYGQHSYSCDWNKHCPCTCGFSRAIAPEEPKG